MPKEIDVFSVNGVKVANIYNNSPVGFLGVFCLNGYIFEPSNKYGVAHFAEHMFFKGTGKRTWKQINRDFAKIGSNANAYTSSDEVCYFVTTMNDQLEASAEILMDMFFNSRYDSEEMEKERNVIIEEKKMYDDDPSYDFANKYANLLAPSYGHDAIGTADSINGISVDDIKSYLNQSLGSSNVMIFFCGNISTENLKSMLEKIVPLNHPFLKKSLVNFNNDYVWNPKYENKDKVKFVYERENTEQAQIIGITNGLSSFDNLKLEEILVLSCLGGGDYSMMYERIREELGLCYSLGVANEAVLYPHVSLTKIFGMTEPQNANKFIDETEKIFEKICQNGLDKDLFECAKNSVSSAILRSVETSKGKASFLMKRIFFGQPITAEDYVGRIKSVTLASCNEVTNAILNKDKVKWAIMVEDKSQLTKE